MILLVFLFSIAFVSATEDVNATDNLQSTDDISLNQEEDITLESQEINDDTTTQDIISEAPKRPGTFRELQRIIDEVPSGYFSIARDYYADEDLTTLTIDKSVTMEGNGHTLDGKLLDRIMTVSLDQDVVVALQNLVFTNGKVNWTNGAGVHISGGIVTLINCTFKDNQGGFGLTGEGGALYAKNCKLRVLNSVFDHNNFERDNNMELYGGAIGSDGDGFCIILNSVFKNNIGGKGGAVWSKTSLTAEGCDFINNTCQYYGGAINANNEARIERCNFIGNKVDYGGSSINIGSGVTTAKIDSCNFIGDRVTYPDYGVYGDTINIIGSSKTTAVINNCTFTNQPGNGCILANYKAKKVTANNNWWGNTDQNKYVKPNVKGENIVLDDWYYLGFNNPSYVPNEKISMELSLRSVKDNSQKDFPSSYTLSNIKGTNATVTPAGKYSIYYKPFPSSDKGSVDLTLNYYNGTHGNFKFNFIHNAKVVTVHNYEELASAIEGLKNIDSNYVAINLAPGNYKATRQINLHAPPKFSVVINGNGNTVDGNGKYGFLDIEVKELTLKNLTINNFVGKCVYTVDTNLNIEHCVFRNNNAGERNGGAIFHYNRAYATKNLKISNSRFYNNKANNGGAVYTFGTARTDIVSSWFGSNVAKNEGGALFTDKGFRFNSPSSSKIDRTGFMKNRANNGGAIYQNVPLYVISSIFADNHAYREAGAIFRNAKFEQSTNNFYYNNTPQNFEYTGGADYSGDDYEQESYPSYQKYSSNYRSIDKITVNNRQIQIFDNKLTLDVLNHIFNKDFRNGHLLVYIDGKLVFNATTTDDLLLIIFDLLDLLFGNHEIKVVFTDNDGNTNTYTENITI